MKWERCLLSKKIHKRNFPTCSLKSFRRNSLINGGCHRTYAWDIFFNLWPRNKSRPMAAIVRIISCKFNVVFYQYHFVNIVLLLCSINKQMPVSWKDATNLGILMYIVSPIFVQTSTIFRWHDFSHFYVIFCFYP